MANFFETEGHRGCRGLLPENTLPAFKEAIKLGVTTLEMDVVISQDGEVVVSHEAFLNHEITTQPDGSFIKENEEKSFNIYKMDYAAIKKFDVGLKIHPRFPFQEKVKAYKPTLSEVIDFSDTYTKKLSVSPIRYNIEIKCMPATDGIYHPLPSTFIDLVMRVVSDKKVENRVTLQSFDIRPLQDLNKKYPDIEIALLYEGAADVSLQEQIDKLGFTPNKYSPEYILVNKELIDTCKKMGVKVIPWTVNELEDMKVLKALGVDGIITDFPNLFAQI